MFSEQFFSHPFSADMLIDWGRSAAASIFARRMRAQGLSTGAEVEDYVNQHSSDSLKVTDRSRNGNVYIYVQIERTKIIEKRESRRTLDNTGKKITSHLLHDGKEYAQEYNQSSDNIEITILVNHPNGLHQSYRHRFDQAPVGRAWEKRSGYTIAKQELGKREKTSFGREKSEQETIFNEAFGNFQRLENGILNMPGISRVEIEWSKLYGRVGRIHPAAVPACC